MTTSTRGDALGWRAAYALTTGATLLVFSEWFFWARPLPGMLPPEGFLTFVLYAAAGYVFLWIVEAFRVRSFAALFLAGAAFGWLVEGIIVQTMYEDLPLSLSFTGLAWHALLSVCVGWYALGLALRRRVRDTAALAGAIGAGFGLWALWWWTEAPPPASLRDFASLSFLCTLVLALASFLSAKIPLHAFRPARIERVCVPAILGVYVVAVTIPAQPRAILVLPPLALLVLAALRRNRDREDRMSAFAWLAAQPPPRPGNLAALLVLPLTSTAVYAAAMAFSWRPMTGWVLYAITVPAGFICFAASVIRMAKPVAPMTPGPEPPQIDFPFPS